MTEVIQGDARNMDFLDDDSVDLIVTSPPYWGLRSYRDDGEHYSGQVGSEDTPQQFVDELVGMIDPEWRRVLKPVGSLWLNLGDKYAGAGPRNNEGFNERWHGSSAVGKKAQEQGRPDSIMDIAGRSLAGGARTKSLLGLPWRVALALIDRGWILRAEVIWDKPNGLPESVQDRVRRSHEQWFHFVLEPQYFSAVDEIREPTTSDSPIGRENARGLESRRAVVRGEGDGHAWSVNYSNPLGRTPGSVWSIPTDPLLVPDGVREQLGLVDHFAAFPQEWPRRLILGWSPSAICEVCEQGLVPVTEISQELTGHTNRRVSGKRDRNEWDSNDRGFNASGYPITRSSAIITGYECDCPEPGETRPSVILDPFGGTGTTAGVARMLGRHGISVDLSADYCRLARWRIFESGHFSKAEDRSWADRQTTLI